MLVRFKQDAVHLNPQIIVINGGTNDIWGNTGPSTPQMIIDNICSMAEIAAKNAAVVAEELDDDQVEKVGNWYIINAGACTGAGPNSPTGSGGCAGARNLA